jgi:hypothetical protein
MNANFNNIGEILGCKNYKTITTDGGVDIEVSSWYQRNTRKFQIFFMKGEGRDRRAVRYAVNTVSEKRVVKEVNDFINSEV